MYKKIPDKFSETFNFGRILFIAPFKTTATMTSHLLCQRRNEYVASLSEELVFSSLTPRKLTISFVNHKKDYKYNLTLYKRIRRKIPTI